MMTEMRGKLYLPHEKLKEKNVLRYTKMQYLKYNNNLYAIFGKTRGKFTESVHHKINNFFMTQIKEMQVQ